VSGSGGYRESERGGGGYEVVHWIHVAGDQTRKWVLQML